MVYGVEERGLGCGDRATIANSMHGWIEPHDVSFADSCPIPNVVSNEGGSDAESSHTKGQIRQEQCVQRPNIRWDSGQDSGQDSG